LGLWFGIGLAADLIFGLLAWRQLSKNLRQLAMLSFAAERPVPLWRVVFRTIAKVMQLSVQLIPATARKPLAACLLVGLPLAAILFAARPVRVPPPVAVSITQSYAPLKVFPVNEGAFFILPDGTLWRWGKTGAPEFARAPRPEQIGVNHHWVKIAAAGTHCLGLRADGTIWGWGFSNARNIPDPQPAVPGHDWIDVATGQHHAVGLRRDGSIWKWNEPLVGNDGDVPTLTCLSLATNWVAVGCGWNSTLALRADGTLWAGGRMYSQKNGTYTNAEIRFPALLCAESNWVALEDLGLARNRAGELWDTKAAVPKAQLGASEVCQLVASDCTVDRVQSISQYFPAQVRPNGTLWVEPYQLSRGLDPPTPGEWRQLGVRTDWQAVWSTWATGYGLTADGTLWMWGYDFGQEPHTNLAWRVEMLRERLGNPSIGSGQPLPPYSLEPRALMKLEKQN
jgi:hypothetical protein